MKENSNSGPEQIDRSDSPTTAGQLWRDRLNQSKVNTARPGVPGSTPGGNNHNRSHYVAPAGTARKSRKGLRPG